MNNSFTITTTTTKSHQGWFKPLQDQWKWQHPLIICWLSGYGFYKATGRETWTVLRGTLLKKVDELFTVTTHGMQDRQVGETSFPLPLPETFSKRSALFRTGVQPAFRLP